MADPIKVYHKNGRVEFLEVDIDEPVHITNIKKAIVSQLQNELKHANKDINEHVDNDINTKENKDFPVVFMSEEESITGKCETLYNIQIDPKFLLGHTSNILSNICKNRDVFKITKTKNFDECSNHPVFHNEYGRLSLTDRTSASSSPTHSSQSTSYLCGSFSNHTILSSTTNHKIIISTSGQLSNKDYISSTSESYLLLGNVESVKSNIPFSTSVKKIYSLIYQTSPANFYNRKINKQQLKSNVKKVMIEFVKNTTSTVGSLQTVNEAVKLMTQDDLLDLERLLVQDSDIEQESKVTILNLLFDVISLAGTDSSLRFINKKILSGISENNVFYWTMLVSNAMRMMKTPSNDLFKEYIQLLKSIQVKSHPLLKGSVAMGLTERLNQVCVNKRAYANTYSYKVFGQVCSNNSTFITMDLIPYIEMNLKEDGKEDDINGIMIWVNALGNLGTTESTKLLIDIIEGKYTSDPHARSIAVYKLIRPTFSNPTLYREIFWKIIENPFEHNQIRMAAITGLTYTSPSTFDFQKLALSTWYEHSNQVHSYIYSTLSTLSKLPDEVPEYIMIKRKANIVLPLAKPCHMGLHFSQNIQVNDYVEILRSALSHKLQFVASEDSIFPRSLFARAEMKGPVSHIQTLETSVYLLGVESLMKSLMNMNSVKKAFYTHDTHKDINSIIDKLAHHNKTTLSPEIHLTLKSFGLQFFSSLKSGVAKEEIETFFKDIQTYIPKNRSFSKYIDLYGYDTLVPTDSGFPVEVSERNPVLITQTVDTKESIEIEGMIIMGKTLKAGVLSTLTNTQFSAGVDVETSLSDSLSIDLLKDGPVYSATISPINENSLNVKVNPFTAVKPLYDSKNLDGEVYSIKTSAQDFKVWENFIRFVFIIVLLNLIIDCLSLFLFCNLISLQFSEIYGGTLKVEANIGMDIDKSYLSKFLELNAKKLSTVPNSPELPMRKLNLALNLDTLLKPKLKFSINHGKL